MGTAPRRRLWIAPLLLSALGSSCAGGASRPSAPLDVTRGAPPARPFSPGRAAPARRAKLDGIASKLDAFFAGKMKESGATGFAVAVIVDGEPAYVRGFGIRDLASGTPVDQDTVFRLASLSKSFTALAMLKLRDEGQLALDDPATKYLPELAAAVRTTRDAPPITLRMLLTNASGLPYDDYWGAVTFGKTATELDALLGRGIQLSSTPGSVYTYSNLGWALLGRVVERVSKRPFREYVTEQILRPLGMTSTVWDPSDVPPGRLATGYRPPREAGSGERPHAIEPTTFEGAFAPAGGLYSSLRDYARYVSYQVAAYPPRDDAESGPVRRSTLREMHEGQRRIRDKGVPLARVTDDGLSLGVASYGFGWLEVASCTERRVQHGGYEPGYFGWTVLIPQARVAYVALATTAAAGIAARFGVFDILRGAGLLAAPEPVAHPALAEAGAAVAGLLEAWSPEVFERAFDRDSVRFSWNDDLRERFAELREAHGRCRPDGQVQVRGPLHGELRLACDRGAVTFELFLSPATPPRLQEATAREELAADERAARVVERVAAAIRDAPDQGDAALFAPSLDGVGTRRTLRRLAIAHGSCAVERSWIAVERGILGKKTSVRASLSCTKGPLELTSTLDRETGQVTSLEVRPPHAFDAACWL